MSRAVRFAFLLFAMTILVPTVAVSQVPPPKPDDPAAMKAKYLAGTTVTGKCTKADGEADPKKVTVQVSYQTKVVDDTQKKALDDATKNYQTAVQQKNKGNIQKFGQQVQQAQAKLYKNDTQTLDLDFVCDKGVTVRRNAAPPKNTATFKDLDGGDVYVKVTLDRVKGSKLKKDELEAGYPISEILIVPNPTPAPKQ
jgi:hypothetical protein